ncbi:MAG: hypothetical protein H6625_01140 [Bdellovibrionaceae bacterium]|nr:hypothetical protein [Pseudobdellovibrionaceae bacterium]
MKLILNIYLLLTFSLIAMADPNLEVEGDKTIVQYAACLRSGGHLSSIDHKIYNLCIGGTYDGYIVGEKVVCQIEAEKAILGLVKGLGQDVKVEYSLKVESLSETENNVSTFQVKLIGEKFISPETIKTWTIVLWDGGDGCMFKSIKLGM